MIRVAVTNSAGDQASRLSSAKFGETNLHDPKVLAGVRFRFPFPDEDHIAPGAFEDFDRAVYVSGLTVPEGIDHFTVQFSAQPGYLVSLPCPETAPSTPGLWTTLSSGLRIARNGFRGAVGIAQQKCRHGMRILILQCGGCGAKWRCETLEDAQPLVTALRSVTPPDARAKFYTAIADRIEQGYAVEVSA